MADLSIAGRHWAPKFSDCPASVAFIISTNGSEPRDWDRLQFLGVRKVSSHEF
jgi:hypothetical protein